MPKIPVSFKQTTRDMNLYLEVQGQEEKSNFIKNAIEYYIKYLKKQKENKE
ncbi:hypothetical protein [Clostridium haemolyticum]|uniref:hypothetical protein n=1 Tax=Clostridium haemolyticum TaxID=84025 RepID=UPI000AE5D33F|nr:hypothetical protein [Clostridium haemolyticum]